MCNLLNALCVLGLAHAAVIKPSCSHRIVQDDAHTQLDVHTQQPLEAWGSSHHNIKLPIESTWAVFFQLLTTNISIGNPPQNFSVTLDTGYADPLLIPGVDCEADGFDGCDERWPQRYNHSDSETFKRNGRKTETEYAAYNYHGHLSWDELRVGDVSVPNVLFDEWERASCRSIGCLAGGFDGAFGLAPPWIETTVQALSPLSALFESSVLDSHSFSLKLPNVFDAIGDITFGAAEPPKNTHNPVEIPLLEEYDKNSPVAPYWPIKLNDLLINNPDPTGDPLRASFVNVTASVISSFPSIMLPNNWGTALNNLIGAEDIMPPFHNVSCEKRGALPPLILGLGPGDQSLTVSSWNYIQRFCNPRDEDDCICASMFEDAADYGVGYDTMVLGNAFLEGFYTTFDADKRSMSFAELIYDKDDIYGRGWFELLAAD